MQKLIPALIAAKQRFLPIVKDGVNPHYKSRYSTLSGILSAIEPGLCAEGLCVLQPLIANESTLTVQTTIYHVSGENISSTYTIPYLSDLQKQGSAITYARRYALLAILGIAPVEDDDDGNSTKDATEQAATKDAMLKEVDLYVSKDAELVKCVVTELFGKLIPRAKMSPQQLVALVEALKTHAGGKDAVTPER